MVDEVVDVINYFLYVVAKLVKDAVFVVVKLVEDAMHVVGADRGRSACGQGWLRTRMKLDRSTLTLLPLLYASSGKDL